MKSDSSAPNQGPLTIRSITKHLITVKHASSIDGDDSDEEIGRLVYESLHTARARSRHAEIQGVAVSTATHERLPDQNQSSNNLGHMSTNDITPRGANWDQTYSTHGNSLIPAKRRRTADEGNGPAPPKIPPKTCHVGYTKMAQEGGVCISHGTNVAPKRRNHGVCNNQAAYGGICVRHGGDLKQKCSHEECTNIDLRGGVCIRHGATKTRRLCSHRGCTNISVQGGVCIRHGAVPARRLWPLHADRKSVV